MPVRRPFAVLLLLSTMSLGCASGAADEKRAFLEAGREVRLAQEPPSHAELRRNLDSFLENDLLLTFDKAKAREGKQSSTLKIVFGAGAATVLAGATAGSLKDHGGAQAAVIGTGIAAMVVAAAGYFGPVRDLRECQEFLTVKGAQLRQWEARYVGDSADPVLAKTWRDYVNLTTEIQLHGSCLPVR